VCYHFLLDGGGLCSLESDKSAISAMTSDGLVPYQSWVGNNFSNKLAEIRVEDERFKSLYKGSRSPEIRHMVVQKTINIS